jgi:hypothetical protein
LLRSFHLGVLDPFGEAAKEQMTPKSRLATE